uniref:Glycosyl transferase CAP10 domain-containing protein n=1 Tax=Timspurckia oligopyrenoides TaxID=708627 RepID=A0A7S0ZFN3_9RHOD
MGIEHNNNSSYCNYSDSLVMRNKKGATKASRGSSKRSGKQTTATTLSDLEQEDVIVSDESQTSSSSLGAHVAPFFRKSRFSSSVLIIFLCLVILVNFSYRKQTRFGSWLASNIRPKASSSSKNVDLLGTATALNFPNHGLINPGAPQQTVASTQSTLEKPGNSEPNIARSDVFSVDANGKALSQAEVDRSTGSSTAKRNPALEALAASARNYQAPDLDAVWRWTNQQRTENFEKLLDKYFEKISNVPPSQVSRASLEAVLHRDPKVRENSVLVTITPPTSINYTYLFSPPTKHSRFPSLQNMLQKLLASLSRDEEDTGFPEVSFLVVLNDGFEPKLPVFGSARHWPSWTRLIPFPIGNTRGINQGFGTMFSNWDDYTLQQYTARHGDYPWEHKLDKAVFRGNFHMETHVLGSCPLRCARARDWRQVVRGKMFHVASTRPDLFDVVFTRKGGDPALIGDVPINPDASMKFTEMMRYKLILNVGSNQNWAERLRNLLFFNSAILRHEADTTEWFYPLLEPYVHYIPFNNNMSNLPQQVEWALSHEKEVQQIVRNANAFASFILSEESILIFARMAIIKFAALQSPPRSLLEQAVAEQA